MAPRDQGLPGAHRTGCLAGPWAGGGSPAERRPRTLRWLLHPERSARTGGLRRRARHHHHPGDRHSGSLPCGHQGTARVAGGRGRSLPLPVGTTFRRQRAQPGAAGYLPLPGDGDWRGVRAVPGPPGTHGRRRGADRGLDRQPGLPATDGTTGIQGVPRAAGSFAAPLPALSGRQGQADAGLGGDTAWRQGEPGCRRVRLDQLPGRTGCRHRRLSGGHGAGPVSLSRSGLEPGHSWAWPLLGGHPQSGAGLRMRPGSGRFPCQR